MAERLIASSPVGPARSDEYHFRRGAEAAEQAAEDERRQEYLEAAEKQRGTDPLLDMVVTLITRGIPVFPLEKKSKKPLLRGWRHDTTTDPLILQFWVHGQGYNIGVPTGRTSRLVVVDPDGDTGRESWAAWQAEHGEAPATLTSITGRADVGHHLVYSIPQDEVGEQWLSGGVGLLGDHLDVKGDGMFFVVPPSIHPKTGKAYEWLDFDVMPAPLPQAILDLLIKRGHRRHDTPAKPLKAPRSIDPNGPEAPPRHRSTPWGKGALAGVCSDLASAREGTRDNTATYAYWRVGRLAASRQVDWVEGIECLEEALEVNGLGQEGVKLHALQEGYRVGLEEPVGPPPPDTPQVDRVTEEELSQLSERFSSFLSTNWDRTARRRAWHPTHTDPNPVTGYNPDGAFAAAMKDRWKQCNVKPNIIASIPGGATYDLRVPCSVRACKVCAGRKLIDVAAYIQDQVNDRPGGTFYRADVDSRRWKSLRRALAPDRLDVDFVKVPTHTGFAVLGYAVGDARSDFEALGGWSAFLDALADVWASMPTGRQNSAQIQFSSRWRAVQVRERDHSKRIGITHRVDQVHALIEQHGGSLLHERKRTTWFLPEGITPEDILDEQKEARRLTAARLDAVTPDRCAPEDPSPGIRKLMLDTNVIDKLAADPELVDLLSLSAQRGEIQLLVTHLQIDEVLEIGDHARARREALLQVLANLPAERVPTYGFLLDRSRLDHAALASDNHAALFRELTRSNPRHHEDVLILLTAAWLYADLVTENRKDLAKMAARIGVAVFDTQGLRGLVQNT
ncbi:MAG: bifunctional DNA primase/polymerase [Acidimicrobiaceae bacterium]|nr:bifunctional DNA primase/polymerase [Acidimicrobiaceae bacterium]